MFRKILLILMIAGAINWGLVGALDFDLVAWICGGYNVASRIIYCIIGLAGILGLALLFNTDKQEDREPEAVRAR